MPNRFVKISLPNSTDEQKSSYAFLCENDIFIEWLALRELDSENNTVQDIEGYFRLKAWDFDITAYDVKLKRVNLHLSIVSEYCRNNPDLNEVKAILTTLESYAKESIVVQNPHHTSKAYYIHHYSNQYLLNEQFFKWFEEKIDVVRIALTTLFIRFFNEKRDRIAYTPGTAIDYRLQTLKSTIKRAHSKLIEKLTDKFILYPITFLFKTGQMNSDEFDGLVRVLKSDFDYPLYQESVYKHSFNIEQQKILTDLYYNFITSQHKQIVYYREFV
jgi:hypothetical protein